MCCKYFKEFTDGSFTTQEQARESNPIKGDRDFVFWDFCNNDAGAELTGGYAGRLGSPQSGVFYFRSGALSSVIGAAPRLGLWRV